METDVISYRMTQYQLGFFNYFCSSDPAISYSRFTVLLHFLIYSVSLEKRGVLLPGLKKKYHF